MCVAAHALDESLKIYACEPAGALDAMYSGARESDRPDDGSSYHRGGSRVLGTKTLPILRGHLARVFYYTRACHNYFCVTLLPDGRLELPLHVQCQSCLDDRCCAGTSLLGKGWA